MIYPFMTWHDNIEVVHSDMSENGEVKVIFEEPVHLGFKSAECYLPEYNWTKNDGFSEEELKELDEYIHSVSHIIIELAQEGGIDNASSF